MRCEEQEDVKAWLITSDFSPTASCEQSSSPVSLLEKGPRQSRAESHGRPVTVLVLAALLAAAAIVIYRLSLEHLRIKRELRALRDDCEALWANCTDSKGEPPACQTKSNETTRSLPIWELHGGKCYYFSSSQSSWEESRCWCQSRGGDLVKVESRDEQRFLHRRVRQLMLDHEDKFWIGLTDAEEEGTWLWVDGSPLRQNLSFWQKDQPDNLVANFAEGQDCVRMGDIWESNPLKTWFDRTCVIHQRFICEKQAPIGNSMCA